MRDFRVTIDCWLDDDARSAVKAAGHRLREKTADEENSSAASYTEITLDAPDAETANRTVNDLIDSHRSDQVWDVERFDRRHFVVPRVSEPILH